ncbi:MAG: DUF1015 domain-containing protein [Planctomycetota bacterium]
MPEVFAFRPWQYGGGGGDVSAKVSPPYDVLDAASKASLLAGDGENIIAVDLPHLPAKEEGPASAYEGAAGVLAGWMESGVLSRRERPAMFAYRQTFEFGGETHRRCGMACTLETVPVGPRDGGGVLPHEETFAGPKADRLSLMRATGMQLSPIFGMHPDAGGEATSLVRGVIESRAADQRAEITEADGSVVLHEVWAVEDEETIEAYRSALAGEDVFIADGHHRYNTAVNYLEGLGLEGLGEIGSDHPARRTMFVLVSMSDPGLVIGPTHRVLGGMSGYSPDAFIDASGGLLEVNPVVNDPSQIEAEMAKVEARGERDVFGIIDFATGLCWTATTVDLDPLRDEFEEKTAAWRGLDVAVIQHFIVPEICVPELNAGEPVTWAFPHTVAEAISIGKGQETGAGGGEGFAQLGIIVRPVPLDVVREVCLAGELMPQKATFFFPKMGTGFFVHSLTD